MTMDFGQALEALVVDGQRVSRTGWNGTGMFLYYVHEQERPFPGTVKPEFFADSVKQGPFIAMKTAQDTVVPWLASQTDILAKDWQVHVD